MQEMQRACMKVAVVTESASDEMRFAALAMAVERRLCKFNEQHLANTTWAFARVNYQDETRFAALAVEVKRRLSKFNEQGLANTAWAFGERTAEMTHAHKFRSPCGRGRAAAEQVK